MGSLFKQIYRYTHGRDFRHNENFWPHITIKRGQDDHIERLIWRKNEIKIESLTALHKVVAGDVTILASGPSVNKIDFDSLSGTTFFGVNGTYHLSKKVEFSYYIIVDRGFVENRFDIVAQVLDNPNLTLFTTVHCLNDILNCVGHENIRCRLAIIEDVSYKVYRKNVPPSEYVTSYSNNIGLSLYPTKPLSGFSWDIRQGVFDAGTVAYWALQIASWLCRGRILLAGVDMNNFSSPRFYENEKNKQKSFLEENFNHVIKPAFLHASRDLSRAGVKVYNLSLTSGLNEEVFEKATPDVIFKK
ncbi:sugar glycosyltransferase [Pantoea sp. EA-12]|uniref:sugar glycosyltransferase n=1 Tax=Pantoea sp. EA-12 TaxID=3043303 RepID=UPI0024B51933|nr:sugar glycosyltransferase [Pantoea sp. EA-12]MDI9223439.1 sugar glycosyltransferase [Pantoea sp. EA-12]